MISRTGFAAARRNVFGTSGVKEKLFYVGIAFFGKFF
jgi:hypothetical protein